MKQLVLVPIVLILTFSCGKSRSEVTKPYQLSDLTDSVIYGDLKFGITRNQFLKRFAANPQQNIMSEPMFDTNVIEVEDGIDLRGYHFLVYHYFDLNDHLYRVRAEFRTVNKKEYEDAARVVGEKLYVHYGIPKRWKTIIDDYKFSWELKNKQVLLIMGCFIGNCMVEVMITDIGLFIINQDHLTTRYSVKNGTD